MKRRHILYFMIIFIYLFYGCLTTSNVILPSKRHEGKWKGVMQNGKEIILTLDNKGYAKLYVDKKLINPNNSKEIYYAIDYTKEPIYLDLIFYDREKESIVIKGIIDFLSESMMRFSTDFNHARPLKFEDNKTIILKKVREF